jgi:hypothetical protein
MRLLAFALVISAVGAGSAYACDKDKTTATAAGTGGSKDVASCCATKASASSVKLASAKGVCTAEMAAKCTPEMAAMCSNKQSAAASNVSADHCAMHGTSASFASAQGASGKVNAAFAGGPACSAHKGAMAAGGKCDGHGMVMQGMASHADCSACEDMANCQNDLEAAGARAQVVSLKNGVMYVYTAETPDRVRAIQIAVSRRNSRMLSAVTAADKARLCSECKLMRGAMASGKLSREVVNVETGCLTLVTSNDRAMIEKIHAMAGPQLAVRVKS